MGYAFLMNQKHTGNRTPPMQTKIYGIKIDTLNPNPESALTYTDDAVGFTPAKMNFITDNFEYGSWQDKFPFNQIKPCVLKDGIVNYYLNPNDYTKKINGTNADITSGNDGDVMVEFPKIYWKFETVGTDLFVRYSDAKIDGDYKCLAHTRGSAGRDKIYISAYMGYALSSKLRSLSGKAPTTSQTIGAYRAQAQANGAGYEQMAYYPLLMLQVLYIVMFKNRNSQVALGKGYVDSGSTSAKASTGNTDTKGLFYGEDTGKFQSKFCGVEDFYGNRLYWIDGLSSDANRNILIGNDNFNDTSNGYTNLGRASDSNLNGYISAIQGSTDSGFLIKEATGSNTTFYTDFTQLFSSSMSNFGGTSTSKEGAGAFSLFVYRSASFANQIIGGRLLVL